MYEDFFEWLRTLDLSIGLCKMNLYHKDKHKQNNNKKTSKAGSLTQKLKDILLMTNTILCGLKKKQLSSLKHSNLSRKVNKLLFPYVKKKKGFWNVSGNGIKAHDFVSCII